MNSKVEIYDTTLRDGTQGEGIQLSVADKLRIADKLSAFGVHYIEGGWPGSNPKDIEFFARAKRLSFGSARLCAFGSTRRKDNSIEDDQQVRLLIEAETPVVTIFGKTWKLHVDSVLRATPDENLSMIAGTVGFLKSAGREVIYDGEHAFDGYKDDPDYAMATFKSAVEAGADVLVLCDTNGGSMPWEVEAVVKAVCARFPSVKVGIHTHNDCGLAVTNALCAVRAGAVHVQGTMNGCGERSGNCDLTSAIPDLMIKMGMESLDGEIAQLREVSQFFDDVANLRHDARRPWVGNSSCAHKGGMHVDAVNKDSRTFEHADPSLVGNSRRILVSDLAGRSNLFLKARELGIPIDPESEHLTTLLKQIKGLEHQGYAYEAADASLALLIKRTLGRQLLPFRVDGYHVSIRKDHGMSVCQATTKVSFDGQKAHTVAEGDGPINALDSALRGALTKFFPEIELVRLVDYKVRIIEGLEGTAARTRVLIQSTDGTREWGTVGVHENIVEASLAALVDSMEFALL